MEMSLLSLETTKVCMSREKIRDTQRTPSLRPLAIRILPEDVRYRHLLHPFRPPKYRIEAEDLGRRFSVR